MLFYVTSYGNCYHLNKILILIYIQHSGYTYRRGPYRAESRNLHFQTYFSSNFFLKRVRGLQWVKLHPSNFEKKAKWILRLPLRILTNMYELGIGLKNLHPLILIYHEGLLLLLRREGHECIQKQFSLSSLLLRSQKQIGAVFLLLSRLHSVTWIHSYFISKYIIFTGNHVKVCTVISLSMSVRPRNEYIIFLCFSGHSH